MTVSVKPFNGPIGAEVHGVALQHPPSAEVINLIEHALEAHGVLVFPQQKITPAQQVEFSRAFAELETTANVDARLDGHPEIFVVGNTGKNLVSFAPALGSDELEWHADHMHRPDPARASLLYCLQTPAEDGDTLFACMYSAFSALTPQEQAQAESLTAIHSVSGLNTFLRTAGEEGAADGRSELSDSLQVKWPLVRHHPDTGRKSLYFGSKVTIGLEGWTQEDARRYLDNLNKQATAEPFCYRHKWSPEDAVLWDNRRVLHAGTPFDCNRYRREMHRTTFRETRPIE